MTVQRILVGVFLLVTGVAAYMTWLCWQAGNDSKWLFGAFTAFFLFLGAAPLLPKAKPAKKIEAITSTRFVPHWFMMLAVLVLLLIVVAGIVGVLKR